MTLHYITGTMMVTDTGGIIGPAGNRYDDLSIGGLALLYNTTMNSIKTANFGGTSLSAMYNWLMNNGGTRQGQDASVPTGYHWSFTPGMTVVIPGDSPSLSPPPSEAEVIPAGPTTEVSISQEETIVGDLTSISPTQAVHAGVGEGFMKFLLLGLGIFALVKIMKAGQKPHRRKKTTKSKSKSKRRRR